jgi:GxxExxY protein
MPADVTPMAADMERARLDALTSQVIGAAQQISNTLGYGFVEKIYENSLALELAARGLQVTQQEPVHVRYRGQVVGIFVPDLLIEGCVLAEIKAIKSLERPQRQQCINYLKATGYRVCLLINFGQPRLEFRRLVWRF